MRDDLHNPFRTHGPQGICYWMPALLFQYQVSFQCLYKSDKLFRGNSCHFRRRRHRRLHPADRH